MEPTIPYNPAPPVNPLEQQARILGIKNLMGQGQMQQQQIQAGNLENQQKQIQLQDVQAGSAAMHEWDGKDMNALPGLMIKHGASVTSVLGMKSKILEQQKMYSDMAKNDAETGSKNIETLAHKNDMALGAIKATEAVPDEQLGQHLMQTAQQLSQQGLIDPQHMQMVQQLSQLPPAQMRTGLSLFEKGLMGDKAQQDAAAKQAALPGIQAESEQKQRTLAGTSPTGVTADQQATLKQGQQRVGLEFQRLQEEKRHNQATEGSLTPEALTMAAQQYAQTGVMPALGRTAGMRSQIMNEAARAYPKLDIATNAAAYKANEDSLKKLQSGFDQVSAFESTANKNLDLFLEQAKKVVDSGVPLINTPLRLISKQMGGVNAPAYDTARQVAVNEIAKVTSNPGLSGQLTDSARKEVSDYNPESATLAQTYHVADILRKDMSNRHDSYAQQIADIKQRLGQSPGTSGTPSAQSGTMEITLPSGKKITIK